MSAPAPRERLLALDVFRGATVAGMLLVNNPGDWGAIYPPLEHAAWDGWTPTDLIFPFFLFIVGITTHLSLSGRRARGDDEAVILRQVLKRGALIILLGWALASFPWWPLTRIANVRIPGVLPRIGLAYIGCYLLTARGTLRAQVLTLVALLYGYWFAMTLLPVPGTDGIGATLWGIKDANIGAWLDRLLLDGHLWRQSRTWDPEGLVSTIPAVGTAMCGVFAGRWLGSGRPLAERLNGLFAAGALAMMLGLMWHWSFPINKSLWTSSYVLFTAGVACVSLAAIMWVTDIHRLTGWTGFFVTYGLNPMVAFLGSGAMARTIASLWKVDVDGTATAVQTVVFRAAYASWLAPKDASLAFAVTFVLFWYAVLRVLQARGIVFKV
ncbi:MAG: hypothetical protein K1X31_14045 [Gemmatimonadaceae bacterium]|nr:hypothetical protein [Gemmatimonadaceae bacterium]